MQFMLMINEDESPYAGEGGAAAAEQLARARTRARGCFNRESGQESDMQSPSGAQG